MRLGLNPVCFEIWISISTGDELEITEQAHVPEPKAEAVRSSAPAGRLILMKSYFLLVL